MKRSKQFVPSTTTNRLVHDCRNSTLNSLRQNKTEMTDEALRAVPFVKPDEDKKKNEALNLS